MMHLGILFLTSLIAQASATTWKSCGEGIFTVKNASLDPAEIKPGTTAHFLIDAIGSDAGDVDGGQIVMLVKLAGLPIYTQQDDLCDKTTCPVAKGQEAKIAYTQVFPEFTPPAFYSVTLTGKSTDGATLFCVLISFEVKPSSALLKSSSIPKHLVAEASQSRKLLAL